jgi:hypothetical protein
MGVIKDISSILTNGEMSTSYKHATLLALFDYIAEQPSEAAANNFHFLPLVDLARRFVGYYWPFSFTASCKLWLVKWRNPNRSASTPFM